MAPRRSARTSARRASAIDADLASSTSSATETSASDSASTHAEESISSTLSHALASSSPSDEEHAKRALWTGEQWVQYFETLGYVRDTRRVVRSGDENVADNENIVVDDNPLRHVGCEPPECSDFWVYCIVNLNPQTKTSTHIGKSMDTFAKPAMHNSSQIRSTTLQPRDRLKWILTQVIGPFRSRYDAAAFQIEWRRNSRGVAHRYNAGMDLAHQYSKALLQVDYQQTIVATENENHARLQQMRKYAPNVAFRRVKTHVRTPARKRQKKLATTLKTIPARKSRGRGKGRKK